MAVVTKTTAKTFFETGDRPTEAEFASLIDSAVFIPAAGATGFVEVESTASATTRPVGAFGVVMLAAGTTASAQGHLGISSLTSANAQGALGVELLSVGTTASAQGHLGAGAVGIQLLEADVTASALNALGVGTFMSNIFDVITTASAVGHLDIIPLRDSPTGATAIAAAIVTVASTIPVSARRFTVFFSSLSAGANAQRIIFQVKDSSGWKTSAYTGVVSNQIATGIQLAGWTTGIMVSTSAAAAHAYVGSMTLELVNTSATNSYSARGAASNVQGNVLTTYVGGFTTTGPITELRVTTSAATPALDGGVMYLHIE